jgi:hypothetical protein
VKIIEIKTLYHVMLLTDTYQNYIEGTTVEIVFSYENENYSVHVVKADRPFNHLTAKLPSYDVYLLGRLFDQHGHMIELPEHEANFLLKEIVTHNQARLPLLYI